MHIYIYIYIFMVLQRVGHDWVTELNWTDIYILTFCTSFLKIFFVHSSLDGPSLDGTLGYFHMLAVVNYVEVIVGVQISFQEHHFISFGSHPGVGLLDHVVILFFLNFWGTSVQFSIMTITNNIQISPFFISPWIVVNFCLFDNSHSNGYEVISHCGSDLHFSW